MKGEFENRLRQVIDEVQASPKPIILFIDEAHTLIGAGGAAGTGDAANLLKPALARGTLRTIARDDVGRIQEVHREGPGAHAALPGRAGRSSRARRRPSLMMRGIASTLEKHHRVQMLDEALEAAVQLSHRYIPARQLPDKAVSLLDTACARVAISQHAVPPELEDCRRTHRGAGDRARHHRARGAVGVETAERSRVCEEKLAAATTCASAELEARWERGEKLVDRILDIRATLRGAVDATAPAGAAGAGAGTPAAAAEGTAAPAAAPAGAPRRSRQKRGRRCSPNCASSSRS